MRKYNASNLGVIALMALLALGVIVQRNRQDAPNVPRASTPALIGNALPVAKPTPRPGGPFAPEIGPARPNRCATAPSAGAISATKLDTQTATYLGTGITDTVTAVEIASDCSVLVAGRLGALDGAAAPQPLVQGVTSSTGALAELIYDGRAVRRQRSFGAIINDLAANATGEILIGGDAGLVRLGANLNTVAWSKTSLGGATRVALGNDGTAAALFGKTLRIFDAQGNELTSRTFGDSAVNDVAVDNDGVYVTGFAQRDGGPCSQLQVAWIRAYTRTGAERWKAWDWTHAEAAATDSSCADTRGMRIAVGRDDGLYFAGESAGGNTIYRRQSKALAETAPNVSTDAYNTGYNTASNHITYIAKIDPANGRVLKGQLLLARLPDTKGNTIRPRAITADEQGRVYVAGVSACCTESRSALTLNGAPLSPYAGGDPFILVLSADLRTRHLWFSAANGGKGETLGVAASRGLAAMGTRADAAPLALDRAAQGTRPATATTGGHVMTWSFATP